MNNKGVEGNTMTYIIAVILGLLVVVIIAYFMFSSPGGPQNMSQALLDFLNLRTGEIESAMP